MRLSYLAPVINGDPKYELRRGETPYLDDVITDAPQGYFRLNEASGTEFRGYKVLSAVSIIPTYTATATTLTGLTHSNTGAISGDNDTSIAITTEGTHLTIPDSADFEFEHGQSFSIEFWVKNGGTTGDYDALLTKHGALGLSERGWTIFLYDNYFYFNSGSLTTMLSDVIGLQSSVPAVTDPNAWYHFVLVFDEAADRVRLYKNGSQISVQQYGSYAGASVVNGSGIGEVDIAGLLNYSNGANAGALRIGQASYVTADDAGFNGALDDIAIYRTALTSARIASHYASRLNTLCQSQFTANLYPTFISTLFDGTTSELYINGRRQCSVTAGTTYAGSATALLVTNGLSPLLFHSQISKSSDGSSVGGAARVKSDFIAMKDRFNSLVGPSYEHIVKNGLTIHIDPAASKDGFNPPVGNCGYNNQPVWDLSIFAHQPYLENMTNCVNAGEGWGGVGISTSPYYFKPAYNNTNQGNRGGGIRVPYSSDWATPSASVQGWFKWDNVAGSMVSFSDSDTSGFSTEINSNGVYHVYVMTAESVALPGTPYRKASYVIPNYNQNTWFNLAHTYDATSGELNLYVNGTLVAPIGTDNPTTKGNIQRTLYSQNPLCIGQEYQNGLCGDTASSYHYRGQIGPFLYYDSALTQSQVRQNCVAQQSRFSGVTCATP